MYARYKKNYVSSDEINYQLLEEISLFGCNVGLIPNLLRKKTNLNQNEPYLWHLNIEHELNLSRDYANSTFIIDLKPKQIKTNLSLYEILDVWGYSDSTWTPILLHLNGLFVDANPNTVNRNNFTISTKNIEKPIYEVLYIDGSVSKGQLVGKWTAPPSSPTNAALLWPETLKYFFKCIQERSPSLLGS